MIMKELKIVAGSARFAWTFSVAALLMILSVQIGINEYHRAIRQVDAGRRLVNAQIAQQSSWRSVREAAFREPDPLTVFASGTTNDIGRYSRIGQTEMARLVHSAYEDEPLFAVFRSVDMAFIVTLVLSLLAILYSFDTVNGERERGTLQLTFSHPVSRVTFLLAKFAGITIALVVPFLLASLVGILLAIVEGVPLVGQDWIRLGTMLTLSVLYCIVFLAVGLLMSVLTRSSNVSFLLSLALWIVFVLIVPRAGMMGAELLDPVPSAAEVQAQRDAFAQGQWHLFENGLMERWKKREEGMAALDADAREQYRKEHEQDWEGEEDTLRNQVQGRIGGEEKRLNEEQRNRKERQAGLGFALGLFSPASLYQLSTMNIANTDAGLKARSEEAMEQFRAGYTAFAERKIKETGNTGGIRISMDSEKGFTFSAPRERGTLKLDDMPQFSPPRQRVEAYSLGIIPHAAGLLAFLLFSFAGTIAAFVRYDIR